MEKLSAVEKVRREVERFLEGAGGDKWQIEIGESMTLDDFLEGSAVTVPACFISYGGFTADPELVRPTGRCDGYEDRIVIYLYQIGDMWPWATGMRDHFNRKEEGERFGNNEFHDLTGALRRFTVQSGDGTRLPNEGVPAFEIVLTV